jgi:hypothetical protein
MDDFLPPYFVLFLLLRQDKEQVKSDQSSMMAFYGLSYYSFLRFDSPHTLVLVFIVFIYYIFLFRLPPAYHGTIICSFE